MNLLKNTSHIKKINEERIREAIKANPYSTKSAIASVTGLSVATCGNILNEMLDRHEIIQSNEPETSNGGRPASCFYYNKEYTYIAGIYLLSENDQLSIGYAVANSIGEIVDEGLENKERIDFESILELLTRLTEEHRQVKAIGIGVPGEVDNGYIDYCDIKTLENYPLGSKLEEVFSQKISIQNDMEFITYGLYQDFLVKNFASIYFPKSNLPGAGFIINGDLLRGNTMFAGGIQYVASVFGINSENQLHLMNDDQTFIEIAAKYIMTIIAIINPAVIVLVGDIVSKEKLALIRKKCEEIIPAKHIPELIIKNNIHESYIRGLNAITLQSLDERFTTEI